MPEGARRLEKQCDASIQPARAKPARIQEHVRFELHPAGAFSSSEALGHSSLEMTRRYANLQAEDLQALYPKVSLPTPPVNYHFQHDSRRGAGNRCGRHQLRSVQRRRIPRSTTLTKTAFLVRSTTSLVVMR